MGDKMHPWVVKTATAAVRTIWLTANRTFGRCMRQGQTNAIHTTGPHKCMAARIHSWSAVNALTTSHPRTTLRLNLRHVKTSWYVHTHTHAAKQGPVLQNPEKTRASTPRRPQTKSPATPAEGSENISVPNRHTNHRAPRAAGRPTRHRSPDRRVHLTTPRERRSQNAPRNERGKGMKRRFAAFDTPRQIKISIPSLTPLSPSLPPSLTPGHLLSLSLPLATPKFRSRPRPLLAGRAPAAAAPPVRQAHVVFPPAAAAAAALVVAVSVSVPVAVAPATARPRPLHHVPALSPTRRLGAPPHGRLHTVIAFGLAVAHGRGVLLRRGAGSRGRGWWVSGGLDDLEEQKHGAQGEGVGRRGVICASKGAGKKKGRTNRRATLERVRAVRLRTRSPAAACATTGSGGKWVDKAGFQAFSTTCSP